MNKFEDDIDNCLYSTDWYEYRCNLARIVETYIQDSDCSWYHIYEKDAGDTKIRSIVFYIYESLYVWTDIVIDGKIESSQLDKPYSDNVADVMYCNVHGTSPFAPLLFKLIDNNEITQIC